MTSTDNIIQFPNQGPDPEQSRQLSEAQLKAAKARTVPEWMEIYLGLIEADLKRIEKANPSQHAPVFEEYRNTGRPRLRRIASVFQNAGLVLDERLTFTGCQPVNTPQGPNVIFDNPTSPWVEFAWPDGSKITFRGVDALSAVGFIMWWSNFQLPIIGSGDEGRRRIINPGETEHLDYMKAKAEDQAQGNEPS